MLTPAAPAQVCLLGRSAVASLAGQRRAAARLHASLDGPPRLPCMVCGARKPLNRGALLRAGSETRKGCKASASLPRCGAHGRRWSRCGEHGRQRRPFAQHLGAPSLFAPLHLGAPNLRGTIRACAEVHHKSVRRHAPPRIARRHVRSAGAPRRQGSMLVQALAA